MTLSVVECWVWPGAKRRLDGRPMVTHTYAYRLLYKLLIDPSLPDDHHLHHTCENTWCVNPWHCEPKTPSAHAAEHAAAHAERERLKRKHVCKNGHDFDDPANVGVNYRMKRGKRVAERYCRACRSMWKKERRERSSAGRTPGA